MKKTYIVDTNVLLSDPQSLYSFGSDDLVITLVVLEELDKQKSRLDDTGKCARHANRILDEFRQSGNLQNGVKLPGGGTLRVCSVTLDWLQALPPELDVKKADNCVIATALKLSKTETCVVVVSRDINVRVKCDSPGLACEDFVAKGVSTDRDSLYSGVRRVSVSSEHIKELHSCGEILISSDLLGGRAFHPNEFVVLSSDQVSSSAIGRYSSQSQTVKKMRDITDAFGLVPRNKEQKMALELLFDADIKLVTLTGPSGTGKSLLAIAAGIDQVKSADRQYSKLIVSRPVQPLGKDIGFLPGTFLEKMEPWVAPIKDNMNFLFRKNKTEKLSSRRSKDYVRDDEYMSLMIEKGIVEIEAVTYIRGRSIPGAFMLIDEAQNITMHELKTIITRVGDGTKIVLTGDIAQIDHLNVDAYTNGLTYAVEAFKDYPIAGHISLQKGERSELATLASKIL